MSLTRWCWGAAIMMVSRLVLVSSHHALSLVKSSWPLKQRREPRAPVLAPLSGPMLQCLIDLQTQNINFDHNKKWHNCPPSGDELLWAVLPVWPGGQPGWAQQVRVSLETWDQFIKLIHCRDFSSSASTISTTYPRGMILTKVIKLISRWDSGVHSEYSELWSLAGPCQVWSK